MHLRRYALWDVSVLVLSGASIYATNAFASVQGDLPPHPWQDDLRKAYEAVTNGRPAKLRVVMHNAGMHAFTVGSTWLPSGAVIAIPSIWVQGHEEEVAKLHLHGVPYSKLPQDTAESLRAATLLPRNEARFASLHELGHAINEDSMTGSAVAVAALLTAPRVVGRYLNTLGPRTPIVTVGVLGAATAVAYLASTAVSRRIMEYNADAFAAKVEPGMAGAGIRYFERLATRNQIIREGHPSAKSPLGPLATGITAGGEMFFNLRHPPLWRRRKALEELAYANQSHSS